MSLPNFLKLVFWDVSSKQIDLEKDKNYVITRIAEKGKLKDVRWMKKRYGVPAIRLAIKKSKNASLKTKNFWQSI